MAEMSTMEIAKFLMQGTFTGMMEFSCCSNLVCIGQAEIGNISSDITNLICLLDRVCVKTFLYYFSIYIRLWSYLASLLKEALVVHIKLKLD